MDFLDLLVEQARHALPVSPRKKAPSDGELANRARENMSVPLRHIAFMEKQMCTSCGTVRFSFQGIFVERKGGTALSYLRLHTPIPSSLPKATKTLDVSVSYCPTCYDLSEYHNAEA